MNDRLSLRPGARVKGRRPVLVPPPAIPLPTKPQRVERREPPAAAGTIVVSETTSAPQVADSAVAPTESRSAQSLRMLVELLHQKLDELAHMNSAIYNDMLETRARIERIERFLAGDEHAFDEEYASEQDVTSSDGAIPNADLSADPGETDPPADPAHADTVTDPAPAPDAEPVPDAELEREREPAPSDAPAIAPETSSDQAADASPAADET